VSAFRLIVAEKANYPLDLMQGPGCLEVGLLRVVDQDAQRPGARRRVADRADPRDPRREPRRLVDGRSHALRPRRRRTQHGDRAAAPGGRSDPSLEQGPASSSRWPSARPAARPASPARWAAMATASTTPSPRASRRSRRSSSAASPGPREPSCGRRSSSTSSSSTTPPENTRPSGWSHRPSSSRSPKPLINKTEDN
jgi:hypothetical protein